MSKAYPTRRTVSTGRYIRLVGKKLAYNSLGGILLASGAIGFLAAAVCVVAGLDLTAEFMLLFAVTLCGASFTLCVVGKSFVNQAKYIEAVVPITYRSVHRLPASDILVRGSHRPRAVPNHELLRSVNECGTPAEQLLRSSKVDE